MFPNGSSTADSAAIALLPELWPSMPSTSPDASPASDRIVNERYRAPALMRKGAAPEAGGAWMGSLVDEVAKADAVLVPPGRVGAGR